MYDLRLMQHVDEAAAKGRERGNEMIEDWRASIKRQSAMGLFPGTANTTNYQASKQNSIAWMNKYLDRAGMAAQEFVLSDILLRISMEIQARPPLPHSQASSTPLELHSLARTTLKLR
jgi:hypothetical protein